MGAFTPLTVCRADTPLSFWQAYEPVRLPGSCFKILTERPLRAILRAHFGALKNAVFSHIETPFRLKFMPIAQIITITQIVLAVLLTAAVLLQNKSTGIGNAFGGETVIFQKRGPEKALFIITIIVAILFFGVSVAALFI